MKTEENTVYLLNILTFYSVLKGTDSGLATIFVIFDYAFVSSSKLVVPLQMPKAHVRFSALE
jgi:hypothetical protein